MLFENLITIVPLARTNPEPAEITEPIAQATLGSFQALWHPAILSRSRTLPMWSRAADPPVAAPGQLILVPEPSRQILPHAWQEQALAAGATVIVGEETRTRILSRMFDGLPEEIGRAAGHVEPDCFFALGLAAIYIEMLTAYMNHVSTLDQEHLQKEALAAAAAAVVADLPTRDDHLRAAFQILTEARERLYAAEIYLLDLCIVEPRAGMDRLGSQLDWQQPISVLASGRTVEQLRARQPAVADQLKRLLDETKVDLIGGEYDEVASTLLPLESHLWQFRRGYDAYQKALGRAPVVFGRRRFGLARHVLQLLNRMELLFLTHFCFDGGVFPVKPDPKVRWEAPDSSTVEALARIPFAADNAAEFLRFPSRLARTIASDFVATLALAHWPSPNEPWYSDLRRMSQFANVFGKFSTLSHYFQTTDAAAISSALSSDDYASPFLANDHNAAATDPVSQYPRHHRARARLEQLRWIMAATQSLGKPHRSDLDQTFDGLEASLENNEPEFIDRMQSAETTSLEQLASLACPITAESQPGVLIFNPLNFERRVVVPLQSDSPEAGAVNLTRPADAQPTRWVSQAVPGMGFAWVPRESATAASEDRAQATAEGETIRNEFLEVEIDPATGGIRSVRDRKNRHSQLAQQLVLVGVSTSGANSARPAPEIDRSAVARYGVDPIKSEMHARSLSVKSAGPELACLEVEGEIVAAPCPAWASDPVLARYRQTYRLGRSQAILRVEVDILEMTPGALDSRVGPWQSYMASRFAWSDSRAVLVRGVGTLAESTRSLRPESPYFVEVHGRRNRAAILTGGLPFHQRSGSRMLDMLLITSTEQCRHFEFGIGVDLANPFQAALELVTPPAMITWRGSPPSGASAWLFHVDASNIVVTSVGSLGAGRRGVRLRLFESAGRYTRVHLRCPGNVAEARATDFHGQRLATLDAQGDTVNLNLSPREITQLEIEFAVA